MTTLETLALSVEHYKMFPTPQNKRYIIKLANQLPTEEQENE